ncbi:MAG: cytochrome c [Terriglobales bacterium]|jgi:mono/diheme cytochrome c family protein
MRNWKPFGAVIIAAVVFFATASFAFESSALGEKVESRNYRTGDFVPTAVAGESWLNHLQRTFNETSMGKTGRVGPPPTTAGEESARWQMSLAPEPMKETVTLRGSDLYRMNCRGCHGEDGQGAPPEINSVINPVRATSVAAIMERMKMAGMDISRSDAAKLAQQSKGMLLERLHRGGQDMPAFPHLRPAEVNSLVAYLRELAGVRGAEAEQVAVREPGVQAGEHIVKSTCHICHSAAGPNPTPQQLFEGAIPPLNTLALRTSRAEFIRKVTHGAPVLMGAPPELYRGRMPVFYYLSEDEAADVYLYLTRYPPGQWAVLEPGPNSTSAGMPPDPSALDAAPQVASAAFTAGIASAGVSGGRSATSADTALSLLPLIAGSVAMMLMGLGLGFTTFELMRLSARNKALAQAADRTGVEGAGAIDEWREPADDSKDRELVA